MMGETGGWSRIVPELHLHLHSGVDVLAVGIYSTRYALHRIWTEWLNKLEWILLNHCYLLDSLNSSKLSWITFWLLLNWWSSSGVNCPVVRPGWFTCRWCISPSMYTHYYVCMHVHSTLAVSKGYSLVMDPYSIYDDQIFFCVFVVTTVCWVVHTSGN